MITLFTSPKPFTGSSGRLQRNAVWSWLALGEEIEILLIGEEEGMARAAAELGVRMVVGVERNELGTPLVSSVFRRAQGEAQHDLLCYLNADILLLTDFLPAVKRVADRLERFLLVGRRRDVAVSAQWSLADFDEPERVRELVARSRPHPPTGSDYFVFRRGEFPDLPPFALGRSGWDNWMIFAGRARGLPVIDASEAVTILHQDHDYRHLPGGQSHYRLPESRRNVELAGGRHTMFTLADATWILTPEALRPKGWREGNLSRRLEAWLYARLGANRLGRAARLLLHPLKALRYWRKRATDGPMRPSTAGQAGEPPMVESTTPNRSDPREI